MLERDGVRAAYDFYFGGQLFAGAREGDGFVVDMDAMAERATPHGFRGCFRVTIDRPSMIEDLHRISAPTLVVVGGNDVHYLDEAVLMADSIPDARRVVLDGLGHAMSVEAPERFAETVLGFLAAP